MSDLPRLVPETSHQSSPHSQHDFSPSCPFCVIARTYGPISPSAAADGSLELDPDKLEPPSFVLYSSEHVIAFLDIMPLTRGHVLVAPRKHQVKVGDLSPDEGAEVCSPSCVMSGFEMGDQIACCNPRPRTTLMSTRLGVSFLYWHVQ
jgi:hypothetical protein